MLRWFGIALLFVATGLGVAIAANLHLLREAAGSVAQTLCSKAFVAGLPAREVYAEHLRPEPGMVLIDWAIRYDLDSTRKEVVVSVAGSFERRSVYREGRGCTLVYPNVALPAPLRPSPYAPALAPDIAADWPVDAADPALRAAVDAAFAEDGEGPPLRTKAVVVVHDGRVIAERYAPGYAVYGPLLSHSIAKSVVNAIVGVLVRRGDLAVSDVAPVAAWRRAGDARGAITVDQLLRMNAGFGFDEGGGASRATHMWFSEPDTASFAADAPLRAPGRWGYNSGSFAVLSRIVGDVVGGGPQGMQDFAARELFDPLGMRMTTLEFDATGTMMGANAMYATPRDFANFGLLYLNDGVVDGRRILPEGWVAYSTRPTGDAGYGAGFWLNNTDAEIPEWGFRWGLPGAPRDAFFARGYLGQYVVIVPSAKLVIVRFGASHGPGAAVDSVGRLVRDVIKSLP